jgi:hypothetical protein
VVKHGTYQTAVPKNRLGRKVIDAERTSKFDVCIRFIEWEVGGKKGYKHIGPGPIFDILVKSKINPRNKEQSTVPSSKMTLSPKMFTSIAPLDNSTIRVKTSRIGFDLALISIAHTPSTNVGLLYSEVKARSE